MKRTFLIVIAILTMTVCAHSQTTKCYNGWGFWQNVNTSNVTTNFRISFKQPTSKSADCQTIWYRFENLYAIPDAYLNFKVDYKQPDGSIHTNHFTYVKLDKTGIFTESGNWLPGYEVVRVYNAEYKEFPGKKKTKAVQYTDSAAYKLPRKRPTFDAMGRRADNEALPASESDALISGNSQTSENNERQRKAANLRQQQLNTLAQVKQQKIAVINTAYNNVNDALGSLAQGLINKSIKRHDEQRDEAFRELENEVRTQHGELVTCTDCDGQGVIKCPDCGGKGYNDCPSCGGTGLVNGRKCSQCFGTGKNVCMKCDGLGSYQCYTCHGTGEIFKVDYNYQENVPAAAPVIETDNNTSASAYRTKVNSLSGNTDINSNLASSHTMLNKMAPLFSISGPDGTAVNLASFKGKKVLLIFWSSLNNATVDEYKQIAKSQALLKAHGYTIIGIGMEFSRYQWSNAITENNLPGIQLCEFSGNESDTSQNYEVNHLPALFLINGLGHITAQAESFNGLKPHIK